MTSAQSVRACRRLWACVSVEKNILHNAIAFPSLWHYFFDLTTPDKQISK